LSKLKQLQRAAVGVASVAVLGTIASAAMASPQTNYFDQSANDPNTTNVPYLAWRGENLRMVKCWGTNEFERVRVLEGAPAGSQPITDSDIGNIFANLVQTNVQLEDWSGEDTGVNTPKEVINGARTFLYYNLNTNRPVICFQDTWASQKAGLGQFKLTVSFGFTNIDSTGVSLGAQVLVMQHQWLAGWMSLNAPTLDEVTSIKPSGTSGVNPEGLGDAKGDGNLIAGDHWYQAPDGTWQWDPNNTHPAEVRATVTGNLPLGQDYSELGLGSSLTLPNDWSKLANALATDASPWNGNPAMRWDIHDEITDEVGNTLTGSGGRSNNATDPVVSVLSPSNMWGDASFTRILQGVNGPLPANAIPSTYPTAGPFDPNFAEETLLPDGHLDAGDAPMPAARIDFVIAPNTDQTKSIDGVGSFGFGWQSGIEAPVNPGNSASKAHDYSIDYTGDPSKKAGNLFAPYYSQWIPATARDPLGYASGVDGALITNNFPGFLFFGRVPNWTAYPLVGASPLDTHCMRTIEDGRPDMRKAPSGAQTVAVYTDEHGEARANYFPGGQNGDDFYFAALNTTPGDDNNGCDLGGVKVLGTSHITAIARYPYQKTTAPDQASKTTLTKTVYSLFDKHLSYYPKNYNASSPNAQNVKIVVAHAQDIQGKPFAGETVCFSASVGAVSSNALIIPPAGPYNVLLPNKSTLVVGNPGQVKEPKGVNGYACTRLDSNGNAVIELTTSGKVTVDVLAYFVDEGLFRDIEVDNSNPSGYVDNQPLTPAMVLSGGSSTQGAGTTPTSPSTVTNIVSSAVAAGFGINPDTTVTPIITGTQIAPVVTAPKVITTGTIHKIVTKVTSLRLVRPAHGKAYVMIKVQSAKKTAKVVIALRNSKNHTLSKMTKTIKTNKQVKITSSSIKLAVKKLALISVK
jgi:hypothetical protein